MNKRHLVEQLEDQLNASNVTNVTALVVPEGGVSGPLVVNLESGGSKIGQIASDGVAGEFEVVATEVERLAADMLTKAQEAFADLNTTAALLRKEGARVVGQIQVSTKLISDVLKVNSDMRDKIARTATERDK